MEKIYLLTPASFGDIEHRILDDAHNALRLERISEELKNDQRPYEASIVTDEAEIHWGQMALGLNDLIQLLGDKNMN